MNKQIQQHLETIRETSIATDRHPDTTKQIENNYLKAMEGKSKTSAIKAFCIECFGYDKGYRESIKYCTSQGCPLYHYRPYKPQGSRATGQESTLESTNVSS